MTALSRTLVAAWGLSLAAVAIAEVTVDDAQRVFAKVASSVVTVRILDEQGGDEAQGSGVIVGAGLVATNCHVVRDAVSVRVVSATGEFTGTWIRQDAQRDICILAVAGLAAPTVSLRGSASLVVGEPVFAVGNPLGFGLAVSSGLIGVVDTKGEHAVVISSAAQSPGSSGGGLFDRDGRLVGITTAVLGTGQNLNLVLSSDGLDQLIAAGNLPRVLAPPPTPERNWEQEAAALQVDSKWEKLESVAKDWEVARPTAADAMIYMGIAQHALNRNPEAIVTLRRALDLDPYHAFAWLIYGRVLKETGRREEANEALSRSEALQPSVAAPSAARAEWLRLDGRLDEARRHIMRSLRLTPGSSSSWRTLGLIEDARGDRDGASRAFQMALRLGEADADVRQRLAQLLAASGKADEASRVTAQTDLGKSESARTQVAIGLAELQRDRLGPAEDALRKAIALAPDLADAWSGLGTVLMRSNRTAEAEKAYDEALKFAPSNSEILSNRAAARLALKRLDAALEDANRAIAIDRESAQAWRLYGMVRMEQKNFREVVVALAKIDAWGKATIDDLVSLGESQGEIGEAENGLKTLARAEAQDANHVRMCLSTAKVLGRKGDSGKALVYLERVVKIEPANHVAWSSKGYGLMKLGRLPEAVEALEIAVSLAPDHSNSWINLGEAQLRTRNLGRAIQALEKAVVLTPQAIDARLFLAQAYLGARLAAKSREQTEQILKRLPAFAPALGLLTMAYLLEGNTRAATVQYLKLKATAPAVARRLRDQAIAGGMMAARQLPE
jgi:tetratricopeptide (TPR) repeat protein